MLPRRPAEARPLELPPGRSARFPESDVERSSIGPLVAEQRRIVVGEQVGGPGVGLHGSLQICSCPAAGEETDRSDTGSCCRFDVVGCVTDHHQVALRKSAILDRCLHDVGVGLRSFGITCRRPLLHQVFDMGGLEQTFQFLILCRRCHDRLQSVALYAQYQVARPRYWTQVWQVPGKKNLAATLEEPFALVAVAADADRLGQQLVAAHSDQWSNFFKRHVVASFREGVHPRLRVSVVAVYERAVDVEDYAFEQLPTSESSESIPLCRDDP